MKERNLLIALAALVIVVAIAFALAAPRERRFDPGNEATEIAASEPDAERPKQSGSRLCASSAGFQQLKAAAFRQAIQVRGDSGNLERLAATSVVRMEGTEVTSEDAETGLVTCTGRFVIELPPGAERGFGGQRRLASAITYSARPGPGGGAAVYELLGADELVSSLAAFDIDSSLQPAAPVAPAPVQTAETTPPEEQLPVIIRRETAAERPEPRSEPRPVPRQEPARPAPTPRPSRTEREEPKERPAPVAERPVARAPATRTNFSNPSFNCRQASSRSERLVCASDRLAAKDRAMSSLFFRSLENADPRARRELERTRNRFLAYRDRCPNEACIAEAYDGRMQEIRDIMNPGE